MKGLYTTLPTLSPDFSGVCSTLFELGGILSIHDAGGCTGTYTGYDEPRWFDCRSRIFTTNLDDAEAVFGDDSILLDKLMEADEWLDVPFFALLGSPSPAVLGTDYHALARLVENKTGKTALAFSTTGMQLYDWGVSQALISLAKNMLPKQRTDVKDMQVNLIGATPLDLTNIENVNKAIAMLGEKGYTVGSCWAMGSSLESIKASLSAQCNIALTSSALAVCRYLKKEYDMPYVIGSFSGKKPFEAMCERLKTQSSDVPEFTAQSGKKALVVGEQVLASSVREMLYTECGYAQVDLAGFFGADEQLLGDKDVFGCKEHDMITIMEQGGYDLIVGDPLLKELISPDVYGNFVDFPHVAVSSRLGWSSPVCPFGEDFLQLFADE